MFTTQRCFIKTGTNGHCPNDFTSKAGMGRVPVTFHPRLAVGWRVEACWDPEPFSQPGTLDHRASSIKPPEGCLILALWIPMPECVLGDYSQAGQQIRGHLDVTTSYFLSQIQYRIFPQLWFLGSICGQMFYKSYYILLSHEHTPLNQSSPFPPLLSIGRWQLQWGFQLVKVDLKETLTLKQVL